MGELRWQKWRDDLVGAIDGVPDERLHLAARVVVDARLVLTAGNGGSASLASHFAQAVAKPDYSPAGGRAAVCLTDHVPTLTAHANDGGWDEALVSSAKPFFRHGTVLVLFSSSGKSRNVCALAKLARDQCASPITVVAFTGFDGEPLKSMAHVSIHVDSHDYEVVEPAHDALLHRVQYHLRQFVL